MNRRDLIAALAAHEAAASALRARLTEDAHAEFEANGCRVSWQTDAGRVATALTKGTVVVDDREALIGWVAEHWPTEVTERTVREVRNERWLSAMVAERPRTATGQILGLDGEPIPGVWYRPGGEVSSVSVTVDSDLKRRLAERARDYAAGTVDLSGLLDV